MGEAWAPASVNIFSLILCPVYYIVYHNGNMYHWWVGALISGEGIGRTGFGFMG